MAWPHLFWKGQIPIDGQVLRVFFPNFAFLKTHLAGLDGWPLWNPHRNMGEPFLADPVTMTAYPPMWILSQLASLLPFFQLWTLFHSLLAGLFMALWVFRRTESWPSACGSAAVIMINGFFISRLTQPHHFASASYIPGIFFAFNHKRPILLAILLALQWLSGFPSFSYITGLALLVWALVRWRTQGKLFVLAGLVALGAAAVQLLPFIEMMMHSIRHVILNPSEAAVFSQPVTQWLKMFWLPQWFLWSPNVVGDPAVVSYYTGQIPLIAALWAAWRGTAGDRSLLAMGALAALLSLGQHLPGYSEIPLLRVIRFPSNWMVLSALTTSYLFGIALARISSVRVRYGLLFVALVDLVLFANHLRFGWFPPSFLTTPPAAVATLRTTLPGRIYHPRALTSGEKEFTLAHIDDYTFLKDALVPSYGMAYGLREVDSLQPLKLRRAEEYQVRLAREGPKSPLLDWAGVSVVVTRAPGQGRWAKANLRIVPLSGNSSEIYFAHPARHQHIEMRHGSPTHREVEVQSPAPATLVFSQVAYPGWTVLVNEREQAMKTFEDTFMAVNVAPGSHIVSWVYRPWTFRVGAFVSVLTWCMLLGFGIRRRREKGINGRLREPRDPVFWT
jgi:hypothetical protein